MNAGRGAAGASAAGSASVSARLRVERRAVVRGATFGARLREVFFAAAVFFAAVFFTFVRFALVARVAFAATLSATERLLCQTLLLGLPAISSMLRPVAADSGISSRMS